MTPCLLDVNVLIALAWPSHVFHGNAHRWFSTNKKWGFRTCPFTQTGFVRVSSNAKFLPDAVTPKEALQMLERVTGLPEHEFWPAELSLLEALPSKIDLVGHRQITDAYLLGLCRVHKARLATLDRGVLSLARQDAKSVVLIH